MRNRHLLTLCCLLLPPLSATPGLAGELLLYAPQPAALEQAPADPRKGVLVKTVTVKRGDTLRKLSRKHIGVAGWFPQVLLFNTIKNPDLIHPGDRLLVPVQAGQAATQQRATKSKKTKLPRKPRAAVKPSAAPSPGEIQAAKPSAAPSPGETQAVMAGETEIFREARQAYLDRDYQKALEQFSSFLSKFPRSRFAADAALYRADSLLRLAGE